MRSAKIIQEAFNLRSTVAVLGFALRTIGQMIEEGKLDELIKLHRSQSPRENFARNKSGRGGKEIEGNYSQNSKPNPFARPTKPEPESEKITSSEESTNEIAETNTGENLPEEPALEASLDSNDKSIEEKENKSTPNE